MAYNVLIVDDSFPMREVIKKVIRASGFDIGQFYEAANGKEALTILDHEWLDLVLTDYNMPDMNGLDLLHKMKQTDMLKNIPVVVVTTEGSEKRLAEFIEEGAIAYIHKPFTPEQIKSQLNQILGEARDESRNYDKRDENLDF